MAEQKSRIYSLPEITEINNDMYLMLDASDTGARRFNLKTFYDKVDGVQASADAANTAATAAAAAVDSANQAAQQAASAAESASTTVQGLVEDVNEAIEAVGDVTELAVPTMSATVKGGAKLGTGLKVTDGILSVNTTASGDGSQAGPILSLEAKGWAEQDATSGKNLLPNTATSQTINGVKFVVNNDGSILVDGTPTSSSTVVFLIGTVQLTEGSTYTISGAAEGSSYNGYSLWLENYSDVYAAGYTFVASSEKNLNPRVRINVKSGTSVSNLTFYPQLELGSTATAYEPYTGGAPSPSPDYPQEIRVARGRNLINESLAKYYKLLGDGTTTSEGSTNAFKTSDYTEVNPSTDYYVQNLIGSLAGYSLAIYDAGKNFIRHITPNGYNVSFGFTTDANARYVRVCYYMPNSTKYVGRPQLELGSTPTPYVPYGYVGMEVQGKNLFAPQLSSTTNGITLTRESDGSYVLNGTATANAFFTVNETLPPGTYTISCNNPVQLAAAGNLVRVVFENSTNADATLLYPNSKATFTAAVNITAWQIRVSNGQTMRNYRLMPQLEKGSTATTYQPYLRSTIPIPLPSRGWVAGLPDGTCDTLTLDGSGKVTWGKACNEVTLDGSNLDAEWKKATNTGVAKYYVNGTNTLKPFMKVTDANLLCDRFVGGNANNMVGAVMMDAGYINVAFAPADMPAISDFMTWIASHNFTVLYKLATPVIEERGYVEMPSVPVGAEISIPELDDLGVRYCVDTSALELARQWYEKAKSEYAEELMELRMTVNELATRVQ